VGYDAGKKVKGRKIHALVDIDRLPMRVIVHSAAIQDRDGAGLVLDKIRRRFPWLESNCPWPPHAEIAGDGMADRGWNCDRPACTMCA
jgi:hypothetical protein